VLNALNAVCLIKERRTLKWYVLFSICQCSSLTLLLNVFSARLQSQATNIK